MSRRVPLLSWTCAALAAAGLAVYAPAVVWALCCTVAAPSREAFAAAWAQPVELVEAALVVGACFVGLVLGAGVGIWTLLARSTERGAPTSSTEGEPPLLCNHAS